MIPAPFEYYSPRSINEALDVLSAHKDDVKMLAGGQSLLPLMKMRLAKPGYLLDIGRISGLDTIVEDGNHVIIGAMATHAQIERSDLLRRRCSLLPQTAATIADVQVRNCGTVRGSLAHPHPAGHLPPAITAPDAQLKAVAPDGGRWVTS